MNDLRIAVHFLQPWTHGRAEDGSPEWPPSPLRLFQALVAAAVSRGVEGDERARAVAALRWLEALPPPEIWAPRAKQHEPYRLYVPDNVGDVAARAWSRGREADLAKSRTEKDVRSLRLLTDSSVHFVYRNVPDVGAHLETLRRATRSMTHLGWGIDMVAGDASTALDVSAADRWLPGRAGGVRLRCPVPGTFDALEEKHAQFLARLDGGAFRPVSPLTTFEVRGYARATDPEPRACAAFRLVEPVTGDRLAFDPARRSRDVAAWVRHAVGELALGWPFADPRGVVHGHEVEGLAPQLRFSVLPLPTITPRRTVEGIARVAITAPPELEDALRWIELRLAGKELLWKGEVTAVLEPLPASDWVLGNYVAVSDHWSTVTPVVLPGHDDRSPRKAEALLRKAFLQSGLECDVVESIQELEWRKVGFRAGLDLATKYLLPDKVRGPLFHVRVKFGAPQAGPLSVGSGRHRGLGVFAKV